MERWLSVCRLGTRSVPEKQAGLPPRAQAALGGPPRLSLAPCLQSGMCADPEERGGGRGLCQGHLGSTQPTSLALAAGRREEGKRPRVRCHTGIAPEAGSHRWGSHGPPGPARSSGKGDESFVLCCRSPFCPQLRILSPGRAGGRLLTSGENFVAYS